MSQADPPRHDRPSTKTRGDAAEAAAARFLVSAGLHIVDRNVVSGGNQESVAKEFIDGYRSGLECGESRRGTARIELSCFGNDNKLATSNGRNVKSMALARLRSSRFPTGVPIAAPRSPVSFPFPRTPKTETELAASGPGS